MTCCSDSYRETEREAHWFLMIFNLFISKGDIANRALINQPATKKGHIYYYIWSEIDHSNDTKSSKRLDVSCSFWFVNKDLPGNNTVTTAICTCLYFHIYITHRHKYCTHHNKSFQCYKYPFQIYLVFIYSFLSFLSFFFFFFSFQFNTSCWLALKISFSPPIATTQMQAMIISMTPKIKDHANIDTSIISFSHNIIWYKKTWI